MERLKEIRSSKEGALATVFFALLVESTLTTAVIPILPFYLEDTIDRGLFFASKVLVQFAVNPLAAWVTVKIGRRKPILFGNACLLCSSMLLIFYDDLTMLFVSRTIQGLGSSFLIVTALELLADSIPSEDERNNAFGKVFTGQPLGALLGPIIAGLFYSVFNNSKFEVYILFSSLCVLSSFMFLIIDPRLRQTVPMLSETDVGDDTPNLREMRQSLSLSFFKFLKDIYIVMLVIIVVVTSSTVALLEPTLPNYWFREEFTSEAFRIGLAFSAFAAGNILALPIIVMLNRWISRYVLVLAGMVVTAFAFPASFLFNRLYLCVIPLMLLGIAISFVNFSVIPMMMSIMERRHHGETSEAYTIVDFATALAYVIGPILGTYLAMQITIFWTVIAFGIGVLICSPLAVITRKYASNFQSEKFSVESKIHPDINSTEENGQGSHSKKGSNPLSIFLGSPMAGFRASSYSKASLNTFHQNIDDINEEDNYPYYQKPNRMNQNNKKGAKSGLTSPFLDDYDEIAGDD